MEKKRAKLRALADLFGLRDPLSSAYGLRRVDTTQTNVTPKSNFFSVLLQNEVAFLPTCLFLSSFMERDFHSRYLPCLETTLDVTFGPALIFEERAILSIRRAPFEQRMFQEEELFPMFVVFRGFRNCDRYKQLFGSWQQSNRGPVCPVYWSTFGCAQILISLHEHRRPVVWFSISFICAFISAPQETACPKSTFLFTTGKLLLDIGILSIMFQPSHLYFNLPTRFADSPPNRSWRSICVVKPLFRMSSTSDPAQLEYKWLNPNEIKKRY